MGTKICKSMKSTLSLLLAIVMVLGIVPPIEVSAASLATPEFNSHDNYELHDIEENLYVSWDKVSGAGGNKSSGYTVAVKLLKGNPGQYYDEENSEVGDTLSYTWSGNTEIKISSSKLKDNKWVKIAVAAKDSNGTIQSNWGIIYILGYSSEEEPYLNLPFSDLTVEAKGGIKYISVEADDNLDWTLTRSSTGDGRTWVKFGEDGTESSYYGTGNEYNIPVYVKENTSADERSVDLVVTSDDGEISITRELTQKGADIDSTDPEINDIVCDLGDSFEEGNYPDFTIEISDDVELDKLKIYLDGDLMETESLSNTYANITYRTSALSSSEKKLYFSSGTHTFEVKAYDMAGNTATATYDYTIVGKPIINATVSSKITIGEIIEISGTITSSDSLLKVVSIEIANPSGKLGYYPYRNASVGKSSFSLSSISTKSSSGVVTAGGIETGCVSAGYVGANYTYQSNAFDFTEPGKYKIAIRAQNALGLISESIHYVELVEPEDTAILGDVNADGKVTNLDRFVLNRYLLGSYVTISSDGADINRDGKIDDDDYVVLSNHLSNISGYEDLYVFSKSTVAKPVLSGLQERYTVKKGDSLSLNFSVIASNGGLVEKITLKHNLTGTLFTPISYTTNKSTYSNTFNISGYPLNTIGSYDFIVYCRASNYTLTDNAIYRFTVDVIESKCTHPTEAIDDIYKSTVYDSAVNSQTMHTYHHTYTRKCTNCGASLGTANSEYFTEPHRINKKGYCLCGYMDNSEYNIWGAYNTSAGRSIVYRNPESTGYYGEIYADEYVTVVGECCDRYLIRYSVSGGTKMGYVNKDVLYRTFTFNGNTIKLYDVIGSTKLYANISELMSQIHGMYDRKSDNTATLMYWRSANTDSAIVINVDLSQADDWDGITFSVKGIKNQTIGYILTTKLDGEHYIDLNQFLEYASVTAYNTEKASNEAELLNTALIRDYEKLIEGCEDKFDGGFKDAVIDPIFCKGVIGAIIHNVQAIMDMSSGELVDGKDIMDAMVLNMIEDKQNSVINSAIECTDAIDSIYDVFDTIDEILPEQYSKFLEGLEKMSDTEYISMLGSQSLVEETDNKNLRDFLNIYGMKIEDFPIDKIGNLRKAVKTIGTIDKINTIVTPLLDGTNRYLIHKKISDNFKDEIKDELYLLKNTASTVAVKNTIQAYITNIESGNYDSIFNASEAWEAAGYTAEYLADNPDIVKTAYNYTYNLSTKGFFGSKIAASATKLGNSGFLKAVNQIYLVDLITRIPKIFAGIIGFDLSEGYDKEIRLAELAAMLKDTKEQLSVYEIDSSEYADAFKVSNKWCSEINSTIEEYFECYPNYYTSKDKLRWREIYSNYTNNANKMQQMLNELHN